MPLVFRFAARSDTGAVRSKNDDSGYAGRYFAVVADGMGGHAGGDVASASTVLDLAHLDTRGFADPDTVLPDEIQTANSFLNKLVKANPKLAGMGTTITSLLITQDRLQFAHIGDSRAYRLKRSRFRQVSKDHTFVQRLVDEGRLDPEQAEYHPHKNVLMRVLGDVDASPELDITSFPLEAGERWLLCSDGLNAVVSERLIEQKMRSTQSLESIVDDLVDLTLGGGAPDNVTVICLEVVEADESALEPSEELPLSEAAVAAASTEYGGPDETMELDVVPVVNTAAFSAHDDDDTLSPLSAAMVRKKLGARPHLLVGAANKAADTGTVPVVGRNVDEHPMAALLTGQPLRPVRHTYSELLDDHHPDAEASPAPEEETVSAESVRPAEAGSADAVAPASSRDSSTGFAADLSTAAAPTNDTSDQPSGEGPENGAHRAGAGLDEDPESIQEEQLILDEDELEALGNVRRRSSWFLPTFVALLAVLVAVVTFLGYVWTQTQYYVGEDQGEVAIYSGVSQSLGPIRLSEVDEHADIAVEDLTQYHRQRVERGIAADDRDHAEHIVSQLGAMAESNAEPRSSESDSAPEDPAEDDSAQGDSAQDEGGEQ
ncbi:PP2C family protein-serine/threonine phosphatase [Nesterenkonia lutea]|uniref:Protein phosphatase n=1 Tax=Nesterenkonia lutea TaxID=272919 RepID=A0ABR9JGX2_9MICC|nr:protein phosphatase 2C domain-containing protein [Nesterenkonia lutea]MBE1525188.1 protein phosphatase [Nesterenkonia lutea]